MTSSMTPNSDNDSLFLAYMQNSKTLISQKANLGQGHAVVHIYTEHIKSLKIPLPPTKAEQTAIAQALSDADELITVLEKLIAKKCDIKQGAMQELLTGKKRLPGFTGKWEVKKLGEIAGRITTGKFDANAMTENGEYRFYTCAKEFYHIDSYAFDAEALLVSGNGANVGYIHYYKGKFNAYQRTYVLTDFTKDIFYVKLFMDSYLKNRITTEVNAGNTPYIKMDTLTDMEIKIPKDKDEQTAIAQILSDMDAEIEALEQKLNKYKMIKWGMMQELLTGQIRFVQPNIVDVQMVAATKVSEATDISAKSGHNWQINEAVVIAALTSVFGSEQYPLGRKRYTKFSYLLHRHVEGKAEGYRKKAAGPYNPDTKYKGPEKIAQDNHYIKPHTNGEFSGFIADESIERAREYFDKWYGSEVLQWLEQFRYESNEQLELLTTVDMAVCELAETERAVSVAGVKNVIRNHPEWKEKLNRPIFSDEDIAAAIKKSQEVL